MTNTFVLTSLLVLLNTVIHLVIADTHWSTVSDEEEEEKKQDVTFGSDTSRNASGRTFHFEVNTTTKFGLEDAVIPNFANAFWVRRLNVSGNDELHDESEDDASLENSIDKDLLNNADVELLENHTTSSLSRLETKPTGPPTPPLKLQLNADMVSSVISVSNSTRTFLISSQIDTTTSSMDDMVPLTTYICVYGDRKCRPSLYFRTTDVESNYNINTLILPTSSFFSPSSMWRIVKSSLRDGSVVSEMPNSYVPVANVSDFISVSSSRPVNISVHTSENVILIDERELEKEETVIQKQGNKSEKLKPIKHDAAGEVNVERTSLKSVAGPVSITGKYISASTRLLPLSLFSSSLEASPTSFSEASSTLSINVEKSHDRLSELPVDVYVGKIIEDPLTGKRSQLISSQPTNLSPTVSWPDAIRNIPAKEDKPTEWNAKDINYLTPVISPSFQESFTTVKFQNLKPKPSESSEKFHEHSFSASILATPLLTAEATSVSVTKSHTTTTGSNEETVPSPRLTNPSCSSLPACVEITLLETTWEEFCTQTYDFREFLSKSVSHYTRPVFPHHIVLDADVCVKDSSINHLQSSPDVTLSFYVTNDSGEYEERLTELCGVILRKWAPTAFRSSVMEVRLHNGDVQATPHPVIPELNSGFVAAVSISAVAGVALCMLCVLLVVMKQKMLQGQSSDTTTPTADAYSLDSLSINASFRRRRNRRSARSYLNHAFNDQEIPSHPLNDKSLSNCLKSRDLLEEEFLKIPMNMPKLDSIPEGAHVKNRYSNILPRPETRVVLADPSGDPLKCYTNANFVKGYGGKSAFYIACQAPLPEGIEDFWRMVWEQQTRVVIMLTMLEENGICRCATYFPQSTLIAYPPFGDFQVSLVKKDVYEFYTLSTLRIMQMEKNLFRDVFHLWFTNWPEAGVPKDPTSLLSFVQQCRPYVNSNTGPSIVHCSTGTGRTGVFLALDICTREYEESRSVDILQCVSQLRRDRAGAVQNKDQYILIYEAMLEYASQVANQNRSPSNNNVSP